PRHNAEFAICSSQHTKRNMDDRPADSNSSKSDTRPERTISRSGHVSLEGIHGTVPVPDYDAGFWRNWRAYVGPALLVSVGYMDPANWGTALAGGAQFKYDLLWVVAAASIMAIFLQVLSARLGVVTGSDLA